MKNRLMTYVTLVVLVMGMSVQTMAQRGPGRGDGRGMNVENPRMFEKIPNLTDEQKEQIKTLRIEHMEDAQEMRAEMKVLRAEMDQLEVAKERDMKAIESKIDEITKLQNKMMKERAKHHNSIRELLTDEQRVFFDQRMDKQGKRGGKRGMKGIRGERGDRGARGDRGYRDCVRN
jgi:Spy/CpxP family protein refolding chaperone